MDDMTTASRAQDLARQRQLIAALRDPACYPHPVSQVHLVETHISWVLLAGRYAYKIKKSVDLGFLDFTDLAARRFYCEEEIRLNRRLAPQLYLDVVSISGSPQSPVLGPGPALEYAVRMRRFAASRQMDRMLARALVTPAHIDRLAATIARFHAGLPPAATDAPFGTAEAIRAPAEQNFQQLRPLLPRAEQPLLDAVRVASERHYAACAPWFEQRRQQGCIRECHGDLHLGNIVVLRDQPTPFDGIEFNANLRWIDVMNETAFLVMDLLQRQRADLAYRYLNGYLEQCGDYAGLRVLRYYLAYRATVRAKIGAISMSQVRATPDAAMLDDCRAYLQLADRCLAPSRPALIITHGLPGCGKTSVAQAVLEQLQAIRIRSDIERKRLFGLAPLQQSGSPIAGGIYSSNATQQTYARLHELARGIVQAGYTVIVDAAFLRRDEREHFHALAQELAVPFVILSVQVDLAILRQRITRRMQLANDASEADLAVLDKLSTSQEPLVEAERAQSLVVCNDGPAGSLNFAQELSRLLIIKEIAS